MLRRSTRFLLFWLGLWASLQLAASTMSGTGPVDSLLHQEITQAPPKNTLPTPPAAPVMRRSFDFSQDLTIPTAPPGNDDNIATELMQLEQQANNLPAIAAARQKIQDAMAVGNFLRRLDSLAWIDFPVILADTISNVPIAIVFDKLRLYPDYAQLEVVVRMELPQQKVSASTGQGTTTGSQYVELFFGTPNLKFSHDGGIIGDAIIGLYSDVPIGSTNPEKFGLVLKRYYETGSGSNTQALGTFVRIDCDGFVEMGVDADVLFSRDWIVPVNGNADPLPTGRVTGSIQTIVNDWQNLLVEISLPNFAPASYTDVAFNLSTAVFDFSDFRNSPNVVFPPTYAQQGLLPPNPSMWRGVFIKNLDVTLPRQIKKKGCVSNTQSPSSGGMLLLDDTGMYAYGDALELPGNKGGPTEPELILPEQEPPTPIAVSNCRTAIGVENLLIDGHGVSGLFYAENVLSSDDGSMEGWRYSIEDLELELVASDVVGFGFGGEVGIPIAKKTQGFGYAAFVNIPDRSFNFNVTPVDTLTFPVFKMADVNIYPGSYLDITVTPDSFEPVAVLNGFAAIRGKLGSKEDDSNKPQDSLSVKAPKINFHKLRLATKGSKLSLMTGGYLSFESEIKVMGYNIPIADPKLTAVPGGGIKLSVDIDFNLMEQNDNGFAVETKVNVKGELTVDDGNDQWESDGLDLDGIIVDIKLQGLEIFGYAYIFDNDPVYGKGWQGSLSVKIGKYTPPDDPMLTVELNAMFGQTSFKYWYVDGFVEWNTATPGIVLGPIEINGFGGGAYYRMKLESVNLMGGSNASMGTMTSGAKYIPYQPTTLGLKATVAFKTPGTDVLDGVATLELRFAGTGLQEIMFYGKAEIVPKNGIPAPGIVKFSEKLRDRISDLPLTKEQSEQKDDNEVKAPYDRILATAFIRMNFEQGFEFQGTFRVYISAAQGVITGQGGVDFLFSTPQNRWHIYVGGYSNNMIIAGDGLPLPPIGVSLNLGQGITAGADAYFLTGNDIPGPPPLHPMAAAYFGISTQPADNRNQLAGRAAQGSGFAFGAAVYANIDKRIRNRGAYSKNSIQADVGAGFDVSLLRYASDTRCSQCNVSPHGHKGWRATGRIWAYLDGHARYRGIGKSLSLGVLIDADLPKPTWLYIQVKFRLVININVKVNIGDRCGTPINN